MNIADIFFGFRGESKQLVLDAKKAGEQAGKTGADGFDKTFSGRIKALKADFAKGGGIPGALMGGVGLGVGLGAFGLITKGIGSVVDFMGQAVTAALEEEKSIAQLTASLEANVPAWDGSTGAIEANIKAAQRLAFDDTTLRESLSLLVAVTHDVTEAQELQATAMDLARFKNISLRDASEALVKVEAGQYRLLKSLGIRLRDNATSTEALAAVQKVAGGQAEAYAKTTAGQFGAAQIALDEVQESIGIGLLPLMKQLADATLAVVDGINAMGDAWGDLGIKGPTSLDKVKMKLLEAQAAAGKWDEMPDRMAEVLGVTGDVMTAEIDARLTHPLQAKSEIIAQIWTEMLEGRFVPATKAAVTAAGGAFDDLSPRVRKAIETVVADVDKLLSPLTGVVRGILTKTNREVDARMADIRWSLEHPAKGEKLRNIYRDNIRKGTNAMNRALKSGNADAYAKAKKFVADMKAKLEELTKADWTFRVTQMQTVASRHSGEHIPGFARGLSYVPYDNFPARLHEGERVLTKAENMAGSAGGGGRMDIRVYDERVVVTGPGGTSQVALASPSQAIRRWRS